MNPLVPDDTSGFPHNFSFVKGDGRAIPFVDNAFDIVYSNSVIEHLHSWENQVRFAREVMRVSQNIWVQTPAKSFFVEPHLLTPFIHYFPRNWQRRLLRNFTLWGLVVRPSRDTITEFLDEVRLLTFKEMKLLFPGCEIRKEKFLFFTKSFIVVRTIN